MNTSFKERLQYLSGQHEALIKRKNGKEEGGNGVFERYRHPILTAQHTPLIWRYDLNQERNPYLMERFGINAVFNAGAILLEGRYLLVARVEGSDRKSFFAVAESDNGIDNFRFRDYPITMPEGSDRETNLYDMRIVQHEDGWIYGLFCSECHDPSALPGDQSSAIAQCGIARTRDLTVWERLPDLRSPSPQQRNVTLHPEFINGKYAFYTRPQDSFIDAGSGGGIGFGLSNSMEQAEVTEEKILDGRVYHTVYEAKNGLGPSPLKTKKGWLHLAHGVRNTAAGLRYVLYVFMTDITDITRVIHKPAGYFMAPQGEERVGDVSNVLFSNGWIQNENETVYIYYASSDSRVHVATTTIDRLLDYVINTPEDGYKSSLSVDRMKEIIDENLLLMKRQTHSRISF